MDRTERFYKIEMLIRSRGSVRFDTLLQELEVSPATLKRDLAYLRERLGAPIEYDAFSRGYRFAQEGWRDTKHELPGMWLSEHELHALLTLHQMLAGLDEGQLLARHLQPMAERLQAMLGLDEKEAKQLQRRVKLISTARRRASTAHFETVCSAVLLNQRLAVRYRKRATGQLEERDLSPQRLVHYRHAWYLDAWCHRSEGLRRFALDAIEGAQVQPEAKAHRLPLKTLEAELDRGYGIFAGGTEQWAELRFEPEAAAWVAQEEWHPKQEAVREPDGALRLRLPYVDATELTMDLLRHAGQVTVLAPPALQAQFAQRLRAAVARLG